MLQALHDAMIDSLKDFRASEETIEAYRRRWGETLVGQFRHFPCPACFMIGQTNSSLKALRPRAGVHFVKCEICDTQFSYVEEGF